MAESFPILMQRVGSALRPCASIDEARIKALSPGKPLRVRVTEPRNVRRFRLYWAMLEKIAENMDPSPAVEVLHDAIKFRLGYTNTIRFASGETVEVVRSISFEKMTEAEYGVFLAAFKDLVATSILPGVNSDVLEAEASEMLGGYGSK
jgi:hypothetical protein